MLWPGMALARAVLVVLADARARARSRRRAPPRRRPCARPTSRRSRRGRGRGRSSTPSCASQPPPQTQLRVDRVDEHRHEEAEDDERGELPALGHRAGRDRRGGVHEHHLEQEEREDADVVGVAAQEEALHAEQAERLAEERDRELVVERRRAAERRRRRRRRPSAARSRRPRTRACPIGVDHEVHRHRVGDVLGAGEAGLDQREARPA